MRVVPSLDPLEYRNACLCLALEVASVQQLTLQGGEESLGHGVVVGVADRAHRRHDAHLAAAFAERVAGVLTASDARLFVKGSSVCQGLIWL